MRPRGGLLEHGLCAGARGIWACCYRIGSVSGSFGVQVTLGWPSASGLDGLWGGKVEQPVRARCAGCALASCGEEEGRQVGEGEERVERFLCFFCFMFVAPLFLCQGEQRVERFLPWQVGLL